MAHQHTYTSLLRLNTTTRLKIKKSLRHIFRGSQPWSPDWAKANAVNSFWSKLRQYRLRTQQRNSKGNPRAVKIGRLRTQIRALHLGGAFQLPLPQIEYHLKNAKLELNNVRRQADNLRDQHLLQLDQARANDLHIPLARETQSRVSIENQRAQGRRLR